MGLLEINDPLLIGHAEIDKDHRHLAELINKGTKAADDQAFDICAEVLRQLVNNLEHHFLTEESIMRDLEYPGLKAHAKHHQSCLAHILKLQSRCRNPGCRGEACVLGALAIILEDLVNADISFKSYLQGIDYKA